MKPETKLMRAILGKSLGNHLDEPALDDDDFLEQVNGASLRDVIENELLKIQEEYARRLPTSRRFKPIIEGRYGLNGDTKTYRQLGKELGVTAERTRQQEWRVIRMLRNPIRLKRLQVYLKEKGG